MEYAYFEDAFLVVLFTVSIPLAINVFVQAALEIFICIQYGFCPSLHH